MRILWETVGFILGEFRQGTETIVLILKKVRLEAFTNGLPMPVCSIIYATSG
jgi:hypothetical protein